MKPVDLARLVALAAIWGASFMLMRVVTPALGAFAALHLPAGYSAILNATTPLFAALFSAIWLGDRRTWRKGIGLGLGFAGVAMVVRTGPAQLGGPALAAIAACLVATLCYGLASIYLRKRASHVVSVKMAAASQLAAGAHLPRRGDHARDGRRRCADPGGHRLHRPATRSEVVAQFAWAGVRKHTLACFSRAAGVFDRSAMCRSPPECACCPSTTPTLFSRIRFA